MWRQSKTHEKYPQVYTGQVQANQTKNEKYLLEKEKRYPSSSYKEYSQSATPNPNSNRANFMDKPNLPTSNIVDRCKTASISHNQKKKII